ncbi:MAG: hypothetical protein PHO80_05790 [Candidatus Gracilibacteria bacterium]|nr:hypothetical protein [Candidatus Gracilibacteria bacterium]
MIKKINLDGKNSFFEISRDHFGIFFAYKNEKIDDDLIEWTKEIQIIKSLPKNKGSILLEKNGILIRGDLYRYSFNPNVGKEFLFTSKEVMDFIIREFDYLIFNKNLKAFDESMNVYILQNVENLCNKI